MAYLSEETIKITATFRNFENELVDPDPIKLSIFNSAHEKIAEYEITNKISLGVFSIDYTFPFIKQKTTLFYEIKGVIDGGNAVYKEMLEVDFY